MNAVVLSRTGVLRLGTGHPWIFPGHIAGVEAADGELVRLEGPAGRVRGFAVYGAASRIPLRIVSRDADFDAGGDWWRERLDLAIRRRADVADEACRWVHAEADGLPGLIVDRYADVAVVQAGCRWADQIVAPLAEHLLAAHGMRGVLARHDGNFRRPEGLAEGVFLIAGEVPEVVRVSIGGKRIDVSPRHGQKTGTFLDQRENQARASKLLPPGRRLDAFCGDGGFALQLAAEGGEVEAWDSSEPALERARHNAELNGLAGSIAFHKVNVFDQLRERVAEGALYDGIVLDPPALAKRRGELAQGVRGYKELNLRALRLLRAGGRLITCSCSFHLDAATFAATLRAAAADARRDVVVLETWGAASCHPAALLFPESAYLKVLVLEVRS